MNTSMNIRFMGACGHQIDMTTDDSTTDADILAMMNQDCPSCMNEDEFEEQISSLLVEADALEPSVTFIPFFKE